MAINIIMSSDLIKVVMTVLFIKLMDITLQLAHLKLAVFPFNACEAYEQSLIYWYSNLLVLV